MTVCALAYDPATGLNVGVPQVPLIVNTALPTVLSSKFVFDAIALSVHDDEIETVAPLAIELELSVGVLPSVV